MNRKTFFIGDEAYDGLISEIYNCSGGCLRERGSVRPMLRPPGRFKVPSDIMIVLERPNEADDKYHGCLTIGPEDYISGSPDPTATNVMLLAKALGRSYKDLYIVNCLLCSQPDSPADDWEAAIKPCLDHGWLKRSVAICNPKVIVTLGRLPLRATQYALTGKDHGTPLMKAEVNMVRKVGEYYIYPLYHVSSRGCANRPNYKEDWKELKTFINSL